VAAVAIARDITIGVGALAFRLWIGPLRGHPTAISKANTAMQMVYLLAVILASVSGFPPRGMLDVLAVLVVFTTVVSGADYVGRFMQRAFARVATS
jgi:cardiolipin synthase